jgi:hypothetical protein
MDIQDDLYYGLHLLKNAPAQPPAAHLIRRHRIRRALQMADKVSQFEDSGPCNPTRNWYHRL